MYYLINALQITDIYNYKYMKNNLTAKLSKKPYRGIMSEIAREQEVSRQTIWEAINKYQNPRIIELATKKINARNNKLKRFENALTSN